MPLQRFLDGVRRRTFTLTLDVQLDAEAKPGLTYELLPGLVRVAPTADGGSSAPGVAVLKRLRWHRLVVVVSSHPTEPLPLVDKYLDGAKLHGTTSMGEAALQQQMREAGSRAA